MIQGSLSFSRSAWTKYIVIFGLEISSPSTKILAAPGREIDRRAREIDGALDGGTELSIRSQQPERAFAAAAIGRTIA